MEYQKVEYRKDVDGLRAIAILSVVLFHFFPQMFYGGFLGVDIFFVISGYVIALHAFAEMNQTGNIAVLSFLNRRFRRIFPALAVMVLLVVLLVILGNFLIYQPAIEGVIDSAFAASYAWSNFFFLNQSHNYFKPVDDTQILLHTWSLSIEAQFYVLVAVILAIRKCRHHLFSICLLLAILSFFLQQFLCANNQKLAMFYLMPSRAYEFIIGIVLAKLHSRTHDSKRLDRFRKMAIAKYIKESEHVIAMAILLLLCGFIIISPRQDNIIIPCLLTALIIAFGKRNSNIVTRFLSTTPMVFIGKISYSLYLYHLPILILGKYYLSTSAQLALTLICAIVSYYCVERPFRQKEGFLSHKRPVIILTLIYVVSLLLVKAYHHQLPSIGLFDKLVASQKFTLTNCAGENDDYDPKAIKECLYQYQKSRQKTVLLLGDSHAAHWNAALDESQHRDALNIMQFSKGSCFPVFAYEQKKNHCSDALKELKAALEAGLKIDVIIFAGKWSGVLLRKNSPEIFLDKMDHTLRFFLAKGIKVIFVRDVVQFNVHVISYAKEMRAKNHNYHHISRDLINEEYLEMDNNIASYLAQKAPKDMVIISPATKQCDEKKCQVGLGHQLFYHDVGHLSYEGAKYWASFDAFFDALL